jgi:hypothetical protein
MSNQASFQILELINNACKHKKLTIQHILSKKEYIDIKDHLLSEYPEISIRVFNNKVIINISAKSVLHYKEDVY